MEVAEGGDLRSAAAGGDVTVVGDVMALEDDSRRAEVDAEDAMEALFCCEDEVELRKCCISELGFSAGLRSFCWLERRSMSDLSRLSISASAASELFLDGLPLEFPAAEVADLLALAGSASLTQFFFRLSARRVEKSWSAFRSQGWKYMG